MVGRLRTVAYGGLASVALVVLLYLISPLFLRLAAGADCDVLFHVPGVDSAVALTLDDGPHPPTTEEILDVLGRYDARATFFVIGSRAARHGELLEAIVREGHELGNHMWKDRTSVALDPGAFEAGLVRTRTLLEPHGAERWLRPGGGRYDEPMVRVAREHGYRLVLGTVYPVDTVVAWRWALVRFLLAWSRPGSVLVLHDGSGRGERTAAVLREVLPALRARGLDVVTVSELVARAEAGRPLRSCSG